MNLNLSSHRISRGDAARQGQEAVSIIERGAYTSPSGREVALADRIARAVAATRDYAPDVSVPAGSPYRSSSTRITVVNGTSLASARAIAARGVTPLVLNFASAKNPGGGFLGGAIAQEESLARSSALYACIVRSPMYAFHRAARDATYSSWMVHSPAVPVFRDDASGALLDEPYDVAFLTAPAPNAKVVLEREPARTDEVAAKMAERVTRALAIASAHDQRSLVLGAWGCGVFGNDPTQVAAYFAHELENAFANVFDEVVFAVLDWSDERRFIGPFAERFG